MATPTPFAQAPKPDLKTRLLEVAKPYSAPYYLAIVGVLGALTTGFIVVIVLLILVAANFNVLGLIE